MGLPPPRLRDLSAWITDENSGTETNSKEVWEIGVPAKNSLYWSLVLSILFSESEEELTNRLTKLTGDEEEAKEVKGKKKLTSNRIIPKVINQKLDSFNPFKNRHNFFHWQEINDVVRIFNLRLKRYSNKLRSRTDKWDDDLKLNSACSLLDCGIIVYFPEEIESRKFLSYPKSHANFKTNVVLFQYENQQHGKRESPINIFHFAMTVQQAHGLKLDALRHFLKKAKINSRSIGNITLLMNSPESHGKAFLPTILQSSNCDTLPEIYRSPYIAFKLSEAGFETDPIATYKEKPSPLFYSLCTPNTKYVRILYDYASNCRCLFDRSVRRADDTVLKTLTRIKSVLESDIHKLNNSNFEIHIVERALHRLKQLNRFVDHQCETASNLRSLKNKYAHELESEEFRKQVIVSILENYLTFFQYGSPKSQNISQQYADYLNFTEYYEYTDNFSFISFFDNFYKLRLSSGLNQEYEYLNVEWKMFLAMMSSKYFPKIMYECTGQRNEINYKESKDVLRYIPLFHRNVVENEVKAFLNKLKAASTSEILKKCLKEEKLDKNSESLEVIDELLISRLKKYIGAALKVSPANDGMKAVLVIERALQVIGECIKPPSSMNSIVSFLLRSCLPSSLQYLLIKLRNDLSHCPYHLLHGRLTIEENREIFEGIKVEIERIQKAFEIVNLTQDLRTEESVTSLCFNELKDKLEADLYKEFEHEYEVRIGERRQKYEKYHEKCIELLLDTLSDLQVQSKNTFNIQHVFGELKSIEYLLAFIQKNKPEEYLKGLLKDFQNFFEISWDKHNREVNEMINKDEELKKMKKEGKSLIEISRKNNELKDILNRQLDNLRCDLDSFLPKCREKILKNNLKKDVILSAPNIELFYKSLTKNTFLSEEIDDIIRAVENALNDANAAKKELKDIFEKGLYDPLQNVDELLKRIMFPHDKLTELKSCFDNRMGKAAMGKLKKCISDDSIKKDVKDMLENDTGGSGYAKTILTKLAFQRRLDSKIYTSVTLSETICEKLETFLTKRVNFLITRLKALKEILIDEDEEIEATWKWGRSEAIQYHLKFLMRQRYSRETTVCASLEMAFLDSINIFHKTTKDAGKAVSINPLAEFYEKSTDLFEGIDLRNIMAHRTVIPETIGEILDEDDFPTEMIKKFLEFIDDTEAIETMLKLFLECGILEENDFLDCIENDKFENLKSLKDVKKCSRWRNYLFLFPFIKN